MCVCVCVRGGGGEGGCKTQDDRSCGDSLAGSKRQEQEDRRGEWRREGGGVANDIKTNEQTDKITSK